MPFATSKAGEFWYDDQGKGEQTLLLLHGWCDNSQVFSRVAPELAQHFRVLTLDWRGHGKSSQTSGDFGYEDLVSDAAGLIQSISSGPVIPIAMSHAGWAALELKKRLFERVPKMVLLDWIMLDPPPPFLGALEALQNPQASPEVREALFAMWKGESPVPEVSNHIDHQMRPTSQEMWARAGREISSAYSRHGNPLRFLSKVDQPGRVLHLYSQPKDAPYLEAQREFSRSNPWFDVKRLDGTTHFPALEVPDQVIHALKGFILW